MNDQEFLALLRELGVRAFLSLQDENGELPGTLPEYRQADRDDYWKRLWARWERLTAAAGR
jgi:hypothetical protein